MSIGKGNKNRKLDSCDNKYQNDGIQWIMDEVEHYLHRRQKHCHDYEGHAPAQAMLIESARGLARAIEPGDDLAIHVQHLALAVDPQTRAAVVHERRAPSGVEWRRLDLVPGYRLAEIQVRAGVHKRIVALHRCLQGGAVHRLLLIWILDGGG